MELVDDRDGQATQSGVVAEGDHRDGDERQETECQRQAAARHAQDRHWRLESLLSPLGLKELLEDHRYKVQMSIERLRIVVHVRYSEAAMGRVLP
jgi:hypothetical protein